MKKKQTESISFYEEDILKILWYYGFIQKRIDNNEHIPARTVRRFLSFFKAPVLDEKNLKKEVLEKARNTTLQFIKDKKYQFHIEKKEQIVYEKKTIKSINGFTDLSDFLKPNRLYPFKELPEQIDEIINYIFNQLDDGWSSSETESKQRLITYVYSTLKKYVQQYTKPPITDYQLIVITGFITSGFGFLMSEVEFKKSPKTLGHYTQYLHRSVKYICEKQKKKI